jgi:hypothetical protein
VLAYHHGGRTLYGGASAGCFDYPRYMSISMGFYLAPRHMSRALINVSWNIIYGFGTLTLG